ncbi:uncharacterized protein TEOVI_000201700 [Trypanosoma equiperdum]|uniref:Expression site-associated gene 9 (ESAG9) protein n=1 Tax=Trypanosoma equiperdum TaxID=5694 RepID=A0A1G4IDX5_TRYEQ|nr:hypothetical protein TEOVI_000201700 [Trypanosoma equiperdum]
MHRLATVPFLTLILLVVRGESKASVVVATTGQECDYWDSSSGGGRCRQQGVGVNQPSNVSPQPASPPSTGGKQPQSVGTVSTTRQEAQESAASSPPAESGAGHPALRVEEPSLKISVQASDRRDGSGRGDETVQPSGSSRVSEPAASPTTEYGEQKVGQEGQKLGAAGEQQSVGDG